MELTKEISYEGNLIQNETIDIKYKGQLFKNNSDEVYIVFGFDKEWKNNTELKMEKKDDGFEAKIKLQEFSELNFCFKNSLNQWDNNSSCDYHLKIEIPPEEEIESDNSINEDLNALLDQIITEVKFADEENKISEIKPDTESYSELVNYFEELFDELFEETNIEQTNIDLAQTFPDEFDNIIPNEEPEIISKPSVDLDNTANIIPEYNEEEKIEEIDTPTQDLALIKTSNKKSIFGYENLSPWYLLKKRIRLALYKIFYVIPSFIFGEEDDEN